MHFRVKFIGPLAYSSNTNQSAKVYTNQQIVHTSIKISQYAIHKLTQKFLHLVC